MSSRCCYILKLPEHILKIILSKLPYSTLIQCKCVSKTWKSILFDSDFRKLHFQSQEGVRDSTTFVLCVEGINLYWLQLSNQSLKYSFTLTAKFKTRYQSQPCELFYLNSCKGLLCVYEFNRQDLDCGVLHILNPVTGEFVNLPSIGKGKDFDIERCVLGFSYETNEFKCFMVTYPRNFESEDQLIAEICTVGSGGPWRKIEAALPDYGFGSEWHSYNVFVNGSYHWLILSDDAESVIAICAFDFDTEQFRSIQLPSSIDEDYNYGHCNIGVFREESLYFACFKTYQTDGVEVWVMNEYGVTESWVKMFIIEQQSGLWEGYGLKVIKIMEDGNILISYENNIFLYDPKKESYQRLDLYGVQPSSTPLHSTITTLVHQPSFLCIKDVAKGDNATALNASRSCS